MNTISTGFVYFVKNKNQSRNNFASATNVKK